MWNKQDFIAKAIMYGQRASRPDCDSAERGLLLSICLEMLAKGALAKEHHTLLSADTKAIKQALNVTASEYVVRTASLSEVIDRLVALHPSLRLRTVEDLKRFNEWRNVEIHTSMHSFESQGEERWLPLATTGIEHLCDVLGLDETAVISSALAEKSSEYQKQSHDALMALVERVKRDAQTKWNSTPDSEKEMLKKAAKNRTAFENVECPVCSSDLLLITTQAPIDTSVQHTKQGIEKVSIHSLKRVRCPACAFSLNNPEELSIASIPEEVSAQEFLDWDELYEAGYIEEYGDE
jgi:ribosomal protein S27E